MGGRRTKSVTNRVLLRARRPVRAVNETPDQGGVKASWAFGQDSEETTKETQTNKQTNKTETKTTSTNTQKNKKTNKHKDKRKQDTSPKAM